MRLRLISGLAALALTLTLSACNQQQLPQNDPQALTFMQNRFKDGDAFLACGIDCSGTYGSARQSLAAAYQNQDWQELANAILTIGSDNDQAWFYLASAADGLGFETAAQRYYLLSLTARFHCHGPINVCDGLDLPQLTFTRLAGIDTKIEQSPTFAQLSAPPPAPGQPAHIKLTNNHGLLMAPVIVDDTVPFMAAVDSGSGLVTIPFGAAILLFKANKIQKSDILGGATATLANGSLVHAVIFKIHTLQVGNVTATNVTGAITEPSSQFLLGQSFLSHYTSWSIDNAGPSLMVQGK